MDSDGFLIKDRSNKLQPATSRAYGWVSDDDVLPSELPRQPIQERSEATASSVGGKQLPEGLLVALAERHPVILGTSVAVLLIILSFAWALPRDRSFAGKRLQQRRMVHPAELAFLSIEADPARVTWIGHGDPPEELLTSRLVYLGKADGILVLYQPPDWDDCEVDFCHGVTLKVHERDVVLRLQVNPPDQDAPRRQQPARQP